MSCQPIFVQQSCAHHRNVSCASRRGAASLRDSTAWPLPDRPPLLIAHAVHAEARPRRAQGRFKKVAL